MSLFVLYALDKPEIGPDIRAKNRADHLEWAKSLGDALRIGGPLFGDDGETMIGSLMVFEFECVDMLKSILKTDPYAKAGLFQSQDIRPYKWVLGADQPA